jgi:hypothetical protein
MLRPVALKPISASWRWNKKRNEEGLKREPGSN